VLSSLLANSKQRFPEDEEFYFELNNTYGVAEKDFDKTRGTNPRYVEQLLFEHLNIGFGMTSAPLKGCMTGLADTLFRG
jgi:hypothetical protein